MQHVTWMSSYHHISNGKMFFSRNLCSITNSGKHLPCLFCIVDLFSGEVWLASQHWIPAKTIICKESDFDSFFPWGTKPYFVQGKGESCGTRGSFTALLWWDLLVLSTWMYLLLNSRNLLPWQSWSPFPVQQSAPTGTPPTDGEVKWFWQCNLKCEGNNWSSIHPPNCIDMCDMWLCCDLYLILFFFFFVRC